MLILLFGITPSTAISSGLVAAVEMRPIGAAVHMRAGTVNPKLVRWMVLGSVPAAAAGAGQPDSLPTSIDDGPSVGERPLVHD